MGVFGSSDSDPSKKLEADIEFIKTRLDLIARQMASKATGADPALDAKLRSIYDAVRAIHPQRIGSSRIGSPRIESSRIEGLDEIKASLSQLVNKTDRSMHLDLAQRLDALESKINAQSESIARQNALISGQKETIAALTSALKELIEHIRNR
jgi:uncharacterized coiled-coil protein SlyX